MKEIVRKFGALFILSVFMLSMVPVTFAQEDTVQDKVKYTLNHAMSINKRINARVGVLLDRLENSGQMMQYPGARDTMIQMMKNQIAYSEDFEMMLSDGKVTRKEWSKAVENFKGMRKDVQALKNLQRLFRSMESQ